MPASGKDASGVFGSHLRSLRNIKPMCGLLWQASPALLTGTVAVRLTRALLPAVLLWIPKKIIDAILGIMHGSDTPSHVWKLLLLEGLLSLLADILSQANTILDTLLGERFTTIVAVRLIDHVATLDLTSFESPAFYDKLERVRGQATGRVFLLTSVLNALQETLTFFTLSAALLIYSPWLLVLVVASTVPTFIGESRFSRQSYSVFYRRTPERRQLEYIRLLGSWSNSAKEVRIFNLARHLSNQYRTLANAIYNENAVLIVKRAAGGAGLGLIALAGYYIGFLNILNAATIGHVTIGTFTFLTGSLARTRMSTERVFSYLTGITEQALLLTDLFDILRLRPHIESRANALPIPRRPRVGLEFRDVRFAYPGSDLDVVKSLNLRIRPAEKVALVGDNGAGKSTIVKLLCRLYEPVSGQILLDDIDLSEYSLPELRESIGVLFQDYVRYDVNVRDNISFGSLRNAGNTERLLSAASRAGAKPLIDSLPQKWEQMLGRRFGAGVDLSGGEWQKVAMSRAMMTNDLLLVLDEPTASFDAEAEEHFTRELQAHREGPAIILISHKLSIARLADRIVVLQRGVIIEEGTHEELMERDGRYAHLFRIQAAGFSGDPGTLYSQEGKHVPCSTQ